MHDNLLPDLKVRPGEGKAQYGKRVTAEMRNYIVRRRRAMTRGDIPVVMDVDDFGFLMPGYDDLLRLKASYPNFRITAFTIPLARDFYHPQNAKLFSIEKYKKWAAIVNEQDWIEVAIHGFSHVHFEMETTYDQAIKLLKATENLFAQVGLKYAKIFKAPFWQYSYDSLVALRDMGYTVAIDRNHQRPTPPGLKTYVYNWSFEEVPPETPQRANQKGYEPIKGHGHFTGKNQNNIGDTLGNILHHIPRDAHFLTIGEYQDQYATE